MNYILASASPRRRELLQQAGLPFQVIPADITEKITKTSPHDIVMELAFQKANHVYEQHHTPNTTVIGADTIVVYRDEILLKPTDESEAYSMLSMLSDRTHQVYTGVTLLTRHREQTRNLSFYDVTDVTFYPTDRYDLLQYIATGDPFDKAGAYGIQGPFAVHVKSICGDYNNVVGLPISKLHQELKTFLSGLT